MIKVNQVFLKTRELGDALLASEEYKCMKQAEEKAMADLEAALTIGRYMEKKQELEEILITDQPDTIALKRLSAELDEVQEKLQAIESVQQMTEARQVFSGLIDQVNQLLRFIVTGELGDSEEPGCGGSCSTCGGCSSMLN